MVNYYYQEKESDEKFCYDFIHYSNHTYYDNVESKKKLELEVYKQDINSDVDENYILNFFYTLLHLHHSQYEQLYLGDYTVMA